YEDGDTTPYGQTIEDCRLQMIWPALEKSAELARRREEVARFNLQNAYKKRGLAMTPVKFGISFTATLLNQAGALVLLYRDGTAQVNHGGTEMGQGLYTKIRGVAMRELGLAEDAVRVMKTRTDKVPNTSATAASSGSDLNGQAVKAACEVLRERLVPLAAKMLNVQNASIRFEGGRASDAADSSRFVTMADLCNRAHAEQISLS